MQQYVLHSVSQTTLQQEGSETVLWYKVLIRRAGEIGTFPYHFTLAELQPAVTNLNLRSPEELTAQIITVPTEYVEPHHAFNYWLVTHLHEGNYAPPLRQIIYSIAIRALSHGQLPDFSRIDLYSIEQAFFKLFSSESMLTQFLADIIALDNEVFHAEFLSPDQVITNQITYAKFVLLHTTDTKLVLSIAPLARPLTFQKIR